MPLFTDRFEVGCIININVLYINHDNDLQRLKIFLGIKSTFLGRNFHIMKEDILINRLCPMDLSPFRRSFEKLQTRQTFYYSWKEHPLFS